MEWKCPYHTLNSPNCQLYVVTILSRTTNCFQVIDKPCISFTKYSQLIRVSDTPLTDILVRTFTKYFSSPVCASESLDVISSDTDTAIRIGPNRTGRSPFVKEDLRTDHVSLEELTKESTPTRDRRHEHGILNIFVFDYEVGQRLY